MFDLLGGVSRAVLRAVLVAALIGILGSAAPAAAQDQRQNAPGEFDYYVLSLSWSPSF
ncbi:MAG TPA: ribonuclease T, partial [Bradyrhizobium sp.]|nr:ribonuclease T [Bradyrhizobium sp.]